MTKRLTPEREQELRKLCSLEMREAFAEIDALRAERDEWDETQITGYCIRCEAIQPKYEQLEKERDQLKKELSDTRQLYYEVVDQRNRFKAEYEKLSYKLECLLCHATGGLYSKSEYTKEQMYEQVDDYLERECEKYATDENQKLIERVAKLREALTKIAQGSGITTDGSGSLEEYEELYDFWHIKSVEKLNIASEALAQDDEMEKKG